MWVVGGCSLVETFPAKFFPACRLIDFDNLGDFMTTAFSIRRRAPAPLVVVVILQLSSGAERRPRKPKFNKGGVALRRYSYFTKQLPMVQALCANWSWGERIKIG